MIKKLQTTPAAILVFVLAIAIGTTFFLPTNTPVPLSETPTEDAHESGTTNPDTSRDSEGDTFSIVAYDKTTGQVGGAGCSCVSYTNGIDFLSDLITDGTSSPNNIVGAIHSQAAYNATTQAFARNRMLAGDTPQEIIDATVASDGNSASRQYGVVGVDVPGAAGFSGASNGDYKNDQQGDNALYTYSIQGNILDTTNGQDLLDDMEAIFNNTNGTLGDKLMAALQAAKRVGGDSRCQTRGNSGRTAFVQVLSPGETSPGLSYDVGDNVAAVADLIEPIDVLQCMYDTGENTPHCRQTVSSFPYTMDFEQKIWEQEVTTCSVNSSWIRSRFATPSNNTGPTGANQGTLYAFVESSNIDGQGTAPRNAMIGSPCFNIPASHTASMTFDYHMVGADMGTLSIEASDNGGSSWTTLWSRSGAQGTNWNNDELIDLSAYAGSTVKIRVNALLGNGFTSDMAIDDIQIDVQPILACPGATKTWDGTNWNPAGAPGTTDTVIINGDYDTDSAADGSFEACSLVVNSGNTLTVNADSYISIEKDILVEGTLLVAHTGNVVQTDPTATVTKGSSGIINVSITTPVLQTRDFMVMGSPMSAETRNGVFTDAFLVLNNTPANFIPHPGVTAGATNFADDDGNYWQSYAGNINVGEGYIVRPQDGYSDPANEAYNMTYTQGTLNNGDVVKSIVYNNVPANVNPDGTPNALANPYASAISGFDFINNNALVNELYFWEHLTPPSASIPGYNSINFSMGDVSMYNMSGGVKAANDPGNSTIPNGVISTGQGFSIKAFGAGTVTFTNDLRLSSGNTTLRSPNQADIDRVWLNVESLDYNIGSNALLAFNPEASDALDRGFDSDRIDTAVSIYSFMPAEEKELGIQTFGTLEEGKKVSIGFASQITENTAYKISIEALEGAIISETDIFLYDTFEDVLVHLNQEDYTFTSNKGNWPERFTLMFDNRISLGVQENKLETVLIYPNPTTGIVKIASPGAVINQIEVYDLQGSLIQKVDNKRGLQTFEIDLSQFQTGVYFLKIDSEFESITKKLIKR